MSHLYIVMARPVGTPERGISEIRAEALVEMLLNGDAGYKVSPTYYHSPAEALEAIKTDASLIDLVYRGYLLRPAVKIDPSWRTRELTRRRNGEGNPMPNEVVSAVARALEGIDFEWKYRPYLSKKFPGKVVYTKHEEHGTLDKQTVSSFAKFLDFMVEDIDCPALSPELTRDLVTLFNATVTEGPRTPYFTSSAEEAVTVYINGPNSCMSHDECEYEGMIHPASVYHGGDLSVAYILKGTAPKDITAPTMEQIEEYTVSARAVVWKDKKIYGRVYGDEYRFSESMAALGYSRDDNALLGAKLPAIPCENNEGCFIMPYLDFASNVTGPVDGFFITTIDSDGLEAQKTNGLSGELGDYCAYYGRRIPGDSVWIEDLQEYYSQLAVEEGHAFFCDFTEEYFSNNVSAYPVVITRNRWGNDEQVWCEDAVNSYTFYCDRTDAYYHQDQFAYACVITSDGLEETWVQSEADEHAFLCEHTNQWYSTEHHTFVLIDGETVHEDYAVAYVKERQLEQVTMCDTDGQVLVHVPGADKLISATDIAD